MWIIITVILALLLGGLAFFIYTRQKNKEHHQISSITGAYCKLADGKTAEAMEELKRIALDGDAPSNVYTTLAVMFRKIGEYKRAIYLNEGLLLRDSGISEDIVRHILKELVTLYKLAGTYGNAQEILKKFAESPMYELYAIQGIVATYNKEYDEAVKLVHKFEKASSIPCPEELSELYYRIAMHSDSSKKIKHLKQALSVRPNNRKAHMAMLMAYAANGKHDAAITTALEIIEQEHMRTWEDMDIVENIFFDNNQIDKLQKALMNKINAGGTDPLPVMYLNSAFNKKHDKEAASELITRFLQNNKNIVVLKEYLRSLDDNVISKWVRYDNIYKCRVCGHEQDYFLDMCPICSRIDSFYFM